MSDKIIDQPTATAAKTKRPRCTNIAILGEVAVGKHCLQNRFALGQYETWRDPHDNYQCETTVAIDGQEVKMDWIIPGSLHKHDTSLWLLDFLKSERPEGFVIVYDVERRRTFEYAKGVYKALCQIQQDPYFVNTKVPPIWVVANKIDLEESTWQVPPEDGLAFSSEIGASFVMMSMKSGQGIEGFGTEFAEQVLRRVRRYQVNAAILNEIKDEQGTEIAAKNRPFKRTYKISGVSYQMRRKLRSLLAGRTTEPYAATKSQAPIAAPQTPPRPYTINIAIVGQDFVGKRSLLDRVGRKFRHSMILAEAPQFHFGHPRTCVDPCDTFRFNSNVEIEGRKVAMCWISVDEPLSFQGSDGVPRFIERCEGHILMYDVSRKETFESVKWMCGELSLKQKRNPSMKLRTPLWIIANKIDLDRTTWQTSLLEGDALSEKAGATFVPMSMRTGQNIEGLGEAFSKEVALSILSVRKRAAIAVAQ